LVKKIVSVVCTFTVKETLQHQRTLIDDDGYDKIETRLQQISIMVVIRWTYTSDDVAEALAIAILMNRGLAHQIARTL